MAGKILTILPENIEKELLMLTNNLRKLGITHIGHGLIVGTQKPTAFFSCKEWARRYDEEDLVSRDPIRACALNTNFKAIPWEYIPSQKEQKPVLEERKREFCAKTGLLISIKNKKLHETFVFGSDSHKQDITQLFNKNLQVFIDHVRLFRRIHLGYYFNNVDVDAK